MTLRDRVAALPQTRGGKCMVWEIQQDHPDLTELLDAVFNGDLRRVAAKAIEAEFAKDGIQLTYNVIYKHRNGSCQSCQT